LVFKFFFVAGRQWFYLQLSLSSSHLTYEMFLPLTQDKNGEQPLFFLNRG